MREIKFRVWDVDRKHMICPPNEHLSLMISGYPMNYQTGQGGEGYLVLMQYTGLKDKNGKAIYEGDILETEPQKKIIGRGFRTAVDYRNGMFCFNPLENRDINRHALCLLMDYEPEIIGNIYENPELLKEKKNE